MADKTTTIAWSACRGRDGWASSPLHIAPDQAREALNVHFYEGGLCTKRAGAALQTVSGMSNFNSLFGGYVPAQDETARELWAVDDSGTNLIRRMAAGTTFTTQTLADNVVAANDKTISWAVLNGKLYIAYDTTVNRMHVYDPGYPTANTVRRAGMGTPAAPTTATIAGAGLSFTRWHKVAYTEQRSSVTVRRSELSAADSLTITDDAGIRVTKPASISEGETHWETYASDTATGTYYLLGTTVVGTTTFDDTNATIPTTTAQPTTGQNHPFPSCKFLYSDGTRLFGFGVWETAAGDSMTPLAGTLYFTPVLDASSIHDDERISNTTEIINRIAVSRNAGGVDRGLNGLGNVPYAFQSNGIYAFKPTGIDNAPLRRVVLSKELGAINNQSIVQAIDELGRPALYFLDPALGPYRISADGLQWCGKDVSDIWATLNPAALSVVAHGVYYPAKYQIWWWLSTGSNDSPDTMIVFDCTLGRFENAKDGVRGGWAKWTGGLAVNQCSALMSGTIGASMSLNLVPYAGSASGTVLMRADSGTQDNGVNFQGYLESGALGDEDWPLHRNKALISAYLEAEATSGVTITQTTLRNMGDETNRTSTALLTAAGSETEVLKKFEGGEMVDWFAGAVRLGDAAAANTAFTLNRWEGLIETRENR